MLLLTPRTRSHAQVGVGATDNAPDRASKRRRDESGAVIKKASGLKDQDNLYAKWRKESKRRIQAPGETEAGGDGRAAFLRQGKPGARYQHTKTRPQPNAHLQKELKTEEQIAKARREKEKKLNRGKGSAKGKGHGGKGGGGVSGRGRGGTRQFAGSATSSGRGRQAGGRGKGKRRTGR